jgi:hypothetical protein
MEKLPVCPHCGSKNVTPVDDFYRCKDCLADFGRAAFADDGTSMIDSVIGLRFRYGDIISGSLRLRFIQDGEVGLYEVYDSQQGGLNKFAGVLSAEEWKELKRKLFEDLYVNDWDRFYYPVNDGREIQGNTEWAFNVVVNDFEEYAYQGVDAYPVYWKNFMKIMDSFFKKLQAE